MEIICRKCNTPKDEKEFSWKRKKENERHSVCKTCKKEVDNLYYLSSKKRRTKIRKTAATKYGFLRDYVQRLKKFGCCKKCSDNRWYVLDFHHLSNKEENINELLRRGSMKKLKKEIRKCILLCSNCHRELHYFEKMGLKLT